MCVCDGNLTASLSIHVGKNKAYLSAFTADRAASVSAYMGLISAVQTLEQTHGKSKLYTTCLGDQHSQ